MAYLYYVTFDPWLWFFYEQEIESYDQLFDVTKYTFKVLENNQLVFNFVASKPEGFYPNKLKATLTGGGFGNIKIKMGKVVLDQKEESTVSGSIVFRMK